MERMQVERYMLVEINRVKKFSSAQYSSVRSMNGIVCQGGDYRGRGQRWKHKGEGNSYYFCRTMPEKGRASNYHFRKMTLLPLLQMIIREICRGFSKTS